MPVHAPVPNPNGTPRAGLTIFQLLAAYGYPAGGGPGQVWRIKVAGARDTQEWQAFLSALPGTPSWVVADQGGSIKLAAARAFPGAQFYPCEAHLRLLAEKKMKAEGLKYTPSWYAARGAFADPQRWADFLSELGRANSTRTLDWINGPRMKALMSRQFSIYQQGRPRSTGGLEQPMREIRARIGERKRNFRNAHRLELVLNLMALDLNGQADEQRYAAIIRRHLLANAGQPQLASKRLDDTGQPSIWTAVWQAEQRLGAQRAATLKTVHAWMKRQRAKSKAARAAQRASKRAVPTP